MTICVIIPAMNEAAAIAGVVRGVPNNVDHIVVVDNASDDGTGDTARAAGADVIRVDKPGYGRACLAGVARAAELEASILVFMDGDGADDPEDMTRIVDPIFRDEADFVVGARLHGGAEAGSLTLPQKFGNALACWLMRAIWKGAFTDLGPFRAIRASTLERLSVNAKTFGWTVEMQVRALKAGVRCAETPVSYRRRIGVSKISGTVKGVVLAGAHILGVIGREALFDRRSRS
ncbi:MAG: glycosyltransferase family 2 protein [Pseudomonadota bacterium]